MPRTLRTILLITIAALSISRAAVGVTIPAPQASYIASEDTAGDDVWDNTGSVAGFDFQFTGNQSPVAVAGGNTTIEEAYAFPGAAATTATRPIGERGGDATFEMWFRPADLTGEHILAEYGGTTGTGLLLDGDTVIFASQATTSSPMFVTASLTSSAVNNFNQAVGIVRMLPSNTGSVELYLNGQFVGSDSLGSGFSLWAGTSATGLGDKDNPASDFGGISLLDGAPTAFDGEIAIHNYYTTALTAEQIAQSFSSLIFVPEPATSTWLLPWLLPGLLLYGGSRRRRRTRSGNSR